MSHTAGPWEVCSTSYEVGVFEIRSGDTRIALIRDVRRFASGGNIDPSSEHLPGANARLIAAAPELLAALRNAEELLFWYANRSDPKWDGIPAPTSVLGEARLAISRATGEAP